MIAAIAFGAGLLLGVGLIVWVLRSAGPQF